MKLKIHITENGEIKVYDMPPNHPVGDFEITVQEETSEVVDDSKALLDFKPTNLGEILDEGLTGGWEHIDIDSVEWVSELRRARQQKRGKWTVL